MTEGADFEDKASYSITIVARTRTAGVAAAETEHGPRGAKYGRLDVTIKVEDKNDAGEVMLSEREPQVGRPVLATLGDDDGGEKAIKWYWFRGLIPTDATVTFLIPCLLWWRVLTLRLPSVTHARWRARGIQGPLLRTALASSIRPRLPSTRRRRQVRIQTKTAMDADAYVLYALVGYKDNKSSDTMYAMAKDAEESTVERPWEHGSEFP